MAIRPDKCIIRGEIDNTVRGRVTGTIWIAGRDEPLRLDLSGDAWADVAGGRLTFTNRAPCDDGSASVLAGEQSGRVGDITFSNRRKIFTVPEDEWRQALHEDRIDEIPFVWKNVLYLEWYSVANGRVFVDSTDFEVILSEKSWTADADDESAQKMLNMEAMRDYLEGMIRRSDPARAKWPEDMTEDEWEESLKENDRLTDAAMEAQEKYEDDPDGDAREAFVMGWDHLSEAIYRTAGREAPGDWPEADEADEDDADETQEFAITPAAGSGSTGDQDDDEESGDDDGGDGDFGRSQHPLQRQAQDYCAFATNLLEGLGGAEDGPPGQSPASTFCRCIYQITGKLAGALNGRAQHRRPDGYILAITRRCLSWTNEGLAALQKIESAGRPVAATETIDALRLGLFALRDGITDLRRGMGRP